MRRAESGQALLELLLLTPFFLAFLLGGALLTQLTLVRLELVHLSREVALGLSRSQSDEPDPTALARALAARSGVLHSLSLTAEAGPALGTGWGLPEEAKVPELAKSVLGGMLESTLGTKLTLRYTLEAPRYARAAFPDGFAFEECVAFKSDPWKDPKGRLKRLASPSRYLVRLFKKKEE